VGPPDPKEVARDVAHGLAQKASDLNRTKGDANHWLKEPEYAAVEAALIEARRRVRLNEGQER